MLCVNTSLQIKALTCHWTYAVRVIQPVWQGDPLKTFSKATYPKNSHARARTRDGSQRSAPWEPRGWQPGCDTAVVPSPEPHSLLGTPTYRLRAGSAFKGDNSAPWGGSEEHKHCVANAAHENRLFLEAVRVQHFLRLHLEERQTLCHPPFQNQDFTTSATCHNRERQGTICRERQVTISQFITWH